MATTTVAFTCLGLFGPYCGRVRPPRSAPRMVDTSLIADVVDGFFGDCASSRMFDRQRRSLQEVTEHFAGEVDNRLTYGEFDLPFFFELLAAARPRPGEIFCDLGSGCGRLVLAAALTHPWRKAVGIELIESLHNEAQTMHDKFVPLVREASLPLAPCTFTHGDALLEIGSEVAANPAAPWVVFAYSTCMPSVGPYLAQLSEGLGLALPKGSRVITTDKRLVNDEAGKRWAFILEHHLTGKNYQTYESDGFVFRLDEYAERQLGRE